MSLLPRCISLALLLTSSGASAGSFLFPENLPGFTGRMAGTVLRPDGPIAQTLHDAKEQCTSVGVYSYQDGPTATTGLTRWLTIQGFKPEEYLRSDTAVLWGAKTDEAELLGDLLFAPAAGQPGRLELCYHSLMEVVTTRVPGQMIVWLLAGVGALGSAAGGLYNRLSERRAKKSA